MWHEGGLLHLLPLCIFALRLLICAFCFVFHLYSNICPAKHIYSNTSGTMSKVNAYVSKVCLFLPFWMVIGARILSLSTANKGPGRRVATSGAAALPLSPNTLIFGERAPLGFLTWSMVVLHGIEMF
jgi:hypothetical protein